MSRFLFISFGAFFYIAFVLCNILFEQDRARPLEQVEISKIVLSPSIALVLYGGDRYLAANYESIRLSVGGLGEAGIDTDYLVRAQGVVSQLNPCHEDNYYLANGLLAWGGGQDKAAAIIRRAIDCRSWDGIPPFFYGINKAFFDQDIDEAERFLNISAMRWPENAAALNKLAIMLRVEKFADEKLALNYLVKQRDSVTDQKLRSMLDKRVVRLTGLVDVRSAQRRYEARYGPLQALDQLLLTGELKSLPSDPLGLGYELRNGRIELQKLKIAGLGE